MAQPNAFLARLADLAPLFDAGRGTHPNVWLAVAAGDRESYPPPLYLFMRAQSSVWRRWESRPQTDLTDAKHGARVPVLLRRREAVAESPARGRPPSCDETAHFFGAIVDIEAFIGVAESAGGLLDPIADCPPVSPLLAGAACNSAPLARWIGRVYSTLREHRPSLILQPPATPDGTELYVLDLDPWEASLLTIRLLQAETPSAASADGARLAAPEEGRDSPAKERERGAPSTHETNFLIPNAAVIAAAANRRREARARLDEINVNREAALGQANALLTTCQQALPRAADYDKEPVVPPERRPEVADALLTLWVGMRAARINVESLIRQIKAQSRQFGGDTYAFVVHLNHRCRDGDREGTIQLLDELDKLPGRRDRDMPTEASQEAVWDTFKQQLRGLLNWMNAGPYLPDVEEWQRLAQDLRPVPPTAETDKQNVGDFTDAQDQELAARLGIGPTEWRDLNEEQRIDRMSAALAASHSAEPSAADGGSEDQWHADDDGEARPQLDDLLDFKTGGYRPGTELGRIVHELNDPPGGPPAKPDELEVVPNPFDLARRPWLPILKERIGQIPELAEGLTEQKLREWLYWKHKIPPTRDLHAQQLMELLERTAAGPVPHSSPEATLDGPPTAPAAAPFLQGGEVPAEQVADKKSGKNLDRWAVATCDGKTWHMYQCVRSTWRQMKRISFREGFQTALVKLLAKGGGFMERQAGLKLWPELFRAGEYKKAMSRLKPELSHLARAIRDGIGVADKTPIFRKEKATWRSEIQIGYAIMKDSERAGAEARWEIKQVNELSAEESIDLG